MSLRTRTRRNNRNRNGRRFKYESASAVTIPGKAKSWSMAHRFVSLSPVIQAVRSDPIATTFFKYSFQLNDVDYFKNLSQYFEEYKITRLTLVYKPLITEVTASHASAAASNFSVPDIVFCYLPYSTTLFSYDQLVSRGDSVIINSTERFQTSFRPVPLVRISDSLLADGFADTGPKWLNTQQQDVPHYGFAIAMQPTGASSLESPTFGGRIELFYSVSFRYPREDSGGLQLEAKERELFPPPLPVGEEDLGGKAVLVRKEIAEGLERPQLTRQLSVSIPAGRSVASRFSR